MKRFFTSHFIPLGFAAAGSLASVSGATFRMWDPTPYRSALDSPFYEGIQGGIIFLEDFEDGLLNTPFVRDGAGPLAFGTTYRSLITPTGVSPISNVDGDDGILDFQESQGDSWITVRSDTGPLEYFDMNLSGDVETHRFIGFYAEEGIRRFRATNTLQVDLLQYGYGIPEP